MPNLRSKEWTTNTPANVEDAQWWEDHLISDADAAKIGTAVQSVNEITPDASGNVELDTLPSGGTTGQVLTKISNTSGDADWLDPASSGHTIQNASGADMTYRENLQFLNAQVTDDSTNDRTIVDCQGEKGDPGDAATVTVGTVTTLPAGSAATVTNSGTTSAAVFNFGIPKGADGTGVGDMTKADYDPNGDVETAGGIVNYVAGAVVANPSGTATTDLNTLQIGSTIYKLAGGGTTIVQIPSVVGDTFTYNGISQGPTITGLDSTHCTVTGATNTNVGSYTLTIALNDTSTMVWSDLTTAAKTYTYAITTKSITIPTVSASLTYDGTTQAPTITNPDSSWITVGGDTDGINAGTYTVIFTLDDTSNTEWSDNTTAAKSATWSIAKASQTISVSSNSVTLDSTHLTATVTVSGNETALSVTSSDPTIVGVSESSGTVTISTINQTTGSATVSIYAAESSNYNQSNTANVYVTANFGQVLTITVYSAASDTVSFTDATGAKTVTTDSSGSGTVSVTISGSSQNITFTSSVAKNPDSLSDAYSKTVNVTSNTTAVYVMPDHVCYWYGYKSSEYEILNTDNGWGKESTTSFIDPPTESTNYVQCTAPQTTTSNKSMIGFKNAISPNSLHVIIEGVAFSGGIHGFWGSSSIKNVDTNRNTAENFSNQTLAHLTMNLSAYGSQYVYAGSVSGRSNKIYAFWYE